MHLARLTLLALLLLAADRSAQTLVENINTQPSSAAVLQWARFVSVGDLLFFDSSDDLWVVDGADAQAELVWSYSPSAPDLDELAPAGDGVAFAGKTKEHGLELWYSDGTAQGNAVVDVVPGPVGSAPEKLLYADGLVYFSAYVHGLGRELWRSDGTAAGTHLVADLVPGDGDSDPEPLGVVGGVLLFAATTPDVGRELWRTDGTSGGTALVADLSPFQGMLLDYSDADRRPVVYDDKLLFAARDAGGPGLFSSDGTTAGTVQLAGGDLPSWLTLAFGEVFFESLGDLVATDGTPGGTGIVKPGGTPQQLSLSASDELFFSATTAATGRELWKSDGTAPGTVLVADLLPGPSDGIEPVNVATPIPSLTPAADGVVFEATDAVWFSDGTAGGTAELLPGSAGTELRYVATAFGKAWFTLDDPLLGSAPWSSDGTVAGTTVVEPEGFGPATLSSNPTYPVALADRLLFSADDGVHGAEPWISDGSEEGTWLLKDIYDEESSWPRDLTYYRGRVWFTARDRAHGRELWSSDGTVAGTRLFLDFTEGEDDSQLEDFTPAGGLLYFTRHDPVGLGTWHEAWVTDGTVAGTVQFTDFDSGFTPFFHAFGDAVLFAKDDALWRTDGTAAGTEHVFDVEPQGSFAQLGDELLFVGYADGLGRELWRTDGTPSGTALVVEIAPGTPFGAYGDAAAAHGRAYFIGDDGAHGREMWTSDGTAAGTVMVADASPGPSDGAPLLSGYPTSAGDRVFWIASNGDGTRSLWVSDDLALGIELAIFCDAFARPTPIGSGPLVLFEADDGVLGDELWGSDGTAAGTHLVADLAPLGFDSNGSSPARAGGTVFFRAEISYLDAELYAVGLDEVGGWSTAELGHGCGLTGAPALDADGEAVLGGRFDVHAASAPPGSVGLLLYTLAYAPLELGACVFFPALDLGLVGAMSADAAGSASLSIPVPNQPGLLAFPVYFQALFAEAGGPFLGVGSLTNALEVVVGLN